AKVPAIELPPVRWSASRPLGMLALALAYVVLGFLLPGRLEGALGDRALDVNRDVDRLSEQVRVLMEEKVLDPERAETLKQKLYDSKLIDADQLKACAGDCKGAGKNSGDGKGSGDDGDGSGDGGKGLAEFLKKHGGKTGLEEAMREQLGNGGVSDDGPGVT